MKRDISEKVRKTVCGTMAMFLTAVCCGTTLQSGTGKSSCPGANRIPMLLVVIEADDFSCPLCMESWTGLLDSLPVRSWNGAFVGILTFSVPSDSGPSSAIDRESILEKQLVGFTLGWRPDFPFLLDRDRAFSGFAHGKSQIVLIDPRSGVVRKWTLPMDPRDQVELLQGLKDSDHDKPL